MIRNLASFVLGVLFVILFVVFFVLNSTLNTLRDTDEFVEIAEESDLYASTIDLSTETLMGELRTQPILKNISEKVIRENVETAITEKWFIEKLRDSYPLLVTAVSDAKDAKVDVRGVKRELGATLMEVGLRMESACDGLFSPIICNNQEWVGRAKSAYETSIKQFLDDFPETVDLLVFITNGTLESSTEENDAIKKIRENFGSLRSLRILGLGLLVGILILFLLLNLPASRVLKSVGGLLIVSTLLFFALSYSVEDGAKSRVGIFFEEKITKNRVPAERKKLLTVVEKLAIGMVSSSTEDARGPVGFVFLGGVMVMGLGFVMSTRKK